MEITMPHAAVNRLSGMQPTLPTTFDANLKVELAVVPLECHLELLRRDETTAANVERRKGSVESCLSDGI